MVEAEEGFVAASSQLGLLRSDLRTELPKTPPGTWTSVATNDQYVYTLQFDSKVYRRPGATSELEKLFGSVPKHVGGSAAYTGMAATSESLFVLDSLASESILWTMSNEPTDSESGPADLEVVTNLPFRAVGLHVDSGGTLYTLPAPEGAAELRSLWRWDQANESASEIPLSVPVPIEPTAAISDTMPGLRAQMFSDEPPWIGVVVQTELVGSPMRLSTIDERVFRVHAETGEVRIVGQRALTWP